MVTGEILSETLSGRSVPSSADRAYLLRVHKEMLE